MPGFRYANLAVRGRRLDQILAEQVPTALDLRPDLVTLFGGGNDVLQGRGEAHAVASALDEAVGALTKVADTVVMFTLTDITGMLPGLGRLRPRVALLNRMIAETAERHGALLVDLRDDPAARDPRYFGANRLHLGELGHRRVAAHLLGLLGVAPDPTWLAPLPPGGREQCGLTSTRESPSRDIRVGGSRTANSRVGGGRLAGCRDQSVSTLSSPNWRTSGCSVSLAQWPPSAR